MAIQDLSGFNFKKGDELRFNGMQSAYVYRGGNLLSKQPLRAIGAEGGRNSKLLDRAADIGVKVAPFVPKTKPKATRKYVVALKTTTKEFEDGDKAAAYAQRYGGKVAVVVGGH